MVRVVLSHTHNRLTLFTTARNVYILSQTEGIELCVEYGGERGRVW